MRLTPAGNSTANNWIIGKLASARRLAHLALLGSLDWAIARLTGWRSQIASGDEVVRDRYARRLANRYRREWSR